ncbi:MAG: FGGY-family carbohydrate kinase [Candidatus Pelethousia sp.]|nr:FGGY-family carbohydrate kinase [Candidatus Pelethousia sp.]
MSKAILAHDLGTTGNKASIYGENGTLLATKYCPYETYYPHADYVEQNPADWWDAICRSTREVIEKAGVSNKDVCAVSFSGQMMALLPVSQTGEILMDRAIIWADSRSVDESAYIEQRLGWKRFYDITGGGMPIALYGVSKALWIKNHYPAVYKNTYKFMSVKDAMIQRLTGHFCTEYSDASNIGLLDIEKRCWSQEIIQAAGLDSAKLVEEIKPSTGIAGHITKAAASATGLMEGTPVICGGGDVPCAALGAGIIREGNAYNCIGSASWFAVATRSPLIDYDSRPFNICHVVPDMCVSQMATFSAGVAHQWVTQNLCDAEAMQSRESGENVYAVYDAKASKVPAGSNGVLFLPNMRPGGAPHNNLDDRGAFVGLKLSNTKDDMLRAVLEGVSFNIRIMCEDIEKKTGLRFSQVDFIGGGSRSEIWSNIQASIMNREFRTLQLQQEANSFGAAMIAGVSLGIYPDFPAAAQRFVKAGKVFRPHAADTAVYDRLYPIYKQLYDALSPINTQLKNVLPEEIRRV